MYKGKHGTSIGQLTELTTKEGVILGYDRTKEQYEEGLAPKEVHEKVGIDNIQLVLRPGPNDFASESVLNLPQQTPIVLIGENDEVIDCGFVGERYAGMERDKQGILLFNDLASSNGASYHTLEELDQVQVRELVPLRTYETS